MTSDEKILVCVHQVPNEEQLIRRGGELSNLLHCPLYVLNIDNEQTNTHEQSQHSFTELWQRKYAEWEATVITKSCDTKKVVEMITDTAKQHNITQLIIGQSGQTRWQEIMHGSIINDLLSRMDGVDLHIVSVDRLNNNALNSHSITE